MDQANWTTGISKTIYTSTANVALNRSPGVESEVEMTLAKPRKLKVFSFLTDMVEPTSSFGHQDCVIHLHVDWPGASHA